MTNADKIKEMTDEDEMARYFLLLYEEACKWTDSRLALTMLLKQEAFKNSCVFCEHCDVFWDYTNGPYLFLCDADCNTEHGLSGQCEIFKELEQKVSEC